MTNFIIHKPITQKFIDEATSLAPKGSLNNKSITKGARNIIGTLAELYSVEMMMRTYTIESVSYDSTYDYDILLDDTIRIDVKTKQRTVQPKPNYECSIAAYSLNIQKCDYYFFTSITVEKSTNRPTDFYFMGYTPKQYYIDNAVFRRKGEPDGGNIKPNGQPFTIVEDCYNLKCSMLKQYPESIMDALTKYGFNRIQW